MDAAASTNRVGIFATALCAALLAGCGETTGVARDATAESGRAKPYANWPDAFDHLPRGPQQTDRVCAREGEDLVRDLFCRNRVPLPQSLTELQTALGVGTSQQAPIAQVARGLFAANSIVSHSTALSARSVSSINPRLFTVRATVMPVQLLVVAFVRGEQFSEIVVTDRRTRQLAFYVVSFRQACNRAQAGCTPTDLLTPAIESNWEDVTLYQEQDFTNTVMDCATCHQPSGPGTPKLMRMQELDDPWTHWFWKEREGGRALLDDYFAAKSDEGYAGLTAAQIKETTPIALNTLVALVNPTQPNKFESARIEAEVKESSAALGGIQPLDNSFPGQSATWRAVYEHSLQGEAMAVPYHDVKATDPQKLAKMTEAYQAFLRGELAALPDIRDVFPDDPQLLSELGVGTEPALSGEEVLLQACSTCHNAQLDQSLSRARFRADLVDMSRAEKDAAIARLELPADNPLAMPPARLRVLTKEARTRAIEALRQ